MKLNNNTANTMMQDFLNNALKKTYASPQIEQIFIDNVISLSLQSEPPAGPEELANQNTEVFRNNPFENQLCV